MGEDWQNSESFVCLLVAQEDPFPGKQEKPFVSLCHQGKIGIKPIPTCG